MALQEIGSPDNWSAQLRKGSLELAILASLWNRSLYGLEVLRALEAGGLPVAEGTLYPILNRLRLDGLLDAEWRNMEAGRPRKYYVLTPAGRQRTAEMSAAWASFSGQMNHFVQSVVKGEDDGRRQ
jgi:PadR family transcriptional regulator PadR